MVMPVMGVQAQNETQTLLGNGKLKSWGLMVSPGLQVGSVYGETALFTQLKAGVVLNGNWTLGGFAGATPLEIYPSPRINRGGLPMEFNLYTSGAFVEYRFKPSRLLHMAIPLAIGGVVNDMDDHTDWNFRDQALTYYYDGGEDVRLFVEPGLNVEMNLHKFARLYAGVSYRMHGGKLYSEGLAVPATGDYLLVNAGLKLGFFDVADVKWKKK